MTPLLTEIVPQFVLAQELERALKVVDNLQSLSLCQNTCRLLTRVLYRSPYSGFQHWIVFGVDCPWPHKGLSWKQILKAYAPTARRGPYQILVEIPPPVILISNSKHVIEVEVNMPEQHLHLPSQIRIRSSLH